MTLIIMPYGVLLLKVPYVMLSQALGPPDQEALTGQTILLRSSISILH